MQGQFFSPFTLHLSLKQKYQDRRSVCGSSGIGTVHAQHMQVILKVERGWWGSCQTSIYKRFQLSNSMPKSVITQISKHMCSFCAILNLVPVAEDFLTTWHLYWVTFPYFGPFLFAFISIYWIIFHTWCNNFLWQPLRCGRARPSPETQKVQHRHYHYHSRNNQKSFFFS